MKVLYILPNVLSHNFYTPYAILIIKLRIIFNNNLVVLVPVVILRKLKI